MLLSRFRLATLKSIFYLGLVMGGVLLPLVAAAAPAPSPYRIPWENGNVPCWDAAGAYHGIDPWLLYAIGYVESRHNPKAINDSNRNKTRDVGLMQINSVHLPELRRYGISESALTNACASTYIGAWIMARNIRKHGYTWQAIAVYNVGSLNTPGRLKTGRAYAQKVYAAYDKMVREHGRARSTARR